MKVVPVYNRVRLSRAILPSPPRLAQPAGHPHHCLAAAHHCDVEDGNCDIYESWNSQFILVCRGLIVDCGLKKHLILVKSLLSHIIITWSGGKARKAQVEEYVLRAGGTTNQPVALFWKLLARETLECSLHSFLPYFFACCLKLHIPFIRSSCLYPDWVFKE